MTVFDTKGIPAPPRSTSRLPWCWRPGVSAPLEAWINTDPLRGGVKVLITGPYGFERQVTFALAEEPGAIT